MSTRKKTYGQELEKSQEILKHTLQEYRDNIGLVASISMATGERVGTIHEVYAARINESLGPRLALKDLYLDS